MALLAKKQFHAGEWVEVLPWGEIEKTLDANGTCDGLPFMPEMMEFCGGRYQVRRYAVEYLAPQGITVIEATCADMIDAASGADVVLAETPSNPGLDVVDLHALALTCRNRGATLIVDNTTATPLGQQPLSLGADLVVASATKALSGHHDLLAGYVAGSHVDQMAAIERERRVAGPILGAFEAWLILRSR